MSKRKKSRKTTRKGPGRYYRRGITIFEVFEIFPNDTAARRWFEEQRWGDDFADFHCPRCGCLDQVWETPASSRERTPYYCGYCQRYFNVRTNTIMQGSYLSYQKWAVAIYYFVTNLKGVSSMKMHRELGVTQKTAWFLDHRIREAFKTKIERFDGPVEVDETYIGGKERNRHWKKKRRSGRGTAGKTIVIGMRDRKSKQVKLKVIPSTKRPIIESFVLRGIETGARIYSDQHKSYQKLPRHKSVNHSRGEYVRGKVHTNGIESIWALFKRGNHGIYHHISPKHLHRYLHEFAGRNNIRDYDTIDQMHYVVAGMVGKRLLYQELVGLKKLRKRRRHRHHRRHVR